MELPHTGRLKCRRRGGHGRRSGLCSVERRLSDRSRLHQREAVMALSNRQRYPQLTYVVCGGRETVCRNHLRLDADHLWLAIGKSPFDGVQPIEDEFNEKGRLAPARVSADDTLCGSGGDGLERR